MDKESDDRVPIADALQGISDRPSRHQASAIASWQRVCCALLLAAECVAVVVPVATALLLGSALDPDTSRVGLPAELYLLVAAVGATAMWVLWTHARVIVLGKPVPRQTATIALVLLWCGHVVVALGYFAALGVEGYGYVYLLVILGICAFVSRCFIIGRGAR